MAEGEFVLLHGDIARLIPTRSPTQAMAHLLGDAPT